MKAASTISRRIPIDQIVIIENTNTRFELDVEWVQHMKFLYEVKRDVPPIEVQLIQTGDPKRPQYALFGGLHRLTAQRELKVKEVEAIVDINNSIYTTESETSEVRLLLLQKGCVSNSRNGKRYSREEKAAVIRQMSLLNESTANIAKWAVEVGFCSKQTVYNLLEIKVQEVKDGRIKKKEECKKLLDQGVTSASEIARRIGEPRKTVEDWCKEEEQKRGQGGEQSKLDCSPPKDDTTGAQSAQPDKTKGRHPAFPPKLIPDEQAHRILDKVSEQLSKLINVSAKVEDYVRTAFLPGIVKQFPSIRKTIKDGGFNAELIRVLAEKRILEEKEREKNATIVALTEKSESIEKDLNSRKEKCGFFCEHTLERLRPENEKTLDYMLSNISHHIHILPFISSDNEIYVLQLTLRLVLPMLSALEWSIHQGFMNEKLLTIFHDFTKLLDEGLINKLNHVKLPEEKYKRKDISAKIIALSERFDEFESRVAGRPASISSRLQEASPCQP